MRFHRDEYLAWMNFEAPGRPMFSELFGLLVGVDAEWRGQGATEDELNMIAFDWDYVPVVGCGGDCGPRGGAAPVVIEDTPTFRIARDYLGRTTQLDKRTATIPLPQDYPVRTMDDWLRLKPLFADQPGRVDPAAIGRAKAARAEGALVQGSIPGGFDIARELMGEEHACLAYYDQPELMRDMIDTLRATSLRVLEQVTEHTPIDHLLVHEDFAGKSGPLIGPDTFREFVGPYYRAAWDLVAARGGSIFSIDTDGNTEPVMAALVEAGINEMLPMEPAAGMDVVKTRREFGRRLRFKGGLDKFVLAKGRAAIRRELEHKLLDPGLRAGGIVFGLDHRIPTGAPLENYRYYIELGRELLGLPPRDPQARGWARMAF